MKESQKITLGVLLILTAGGVVGLILSGSSPANQSKSSSAQAANLISINQQYLNTARRLLGLAMTADEQQVAQDALRITDEELDLDFAAALQAAGRQPAIETPEVRDIQGKIAKIQAAIDAKQTEVKQLTDSARKARAGQQDALQQQLDVSQAELSFYKERLDDTKDDLVRAGGDPRSKVQQLVDEHQAASHTADSVKAPPVNPPASAPTSLLGKWSQWKSIRARDREVVDAEREALQAADDLVRRRGPIAERVQAEQAQRNAASGGGTPGQSSALTPQTSAGRVALLQELGEDRKELSILDRRIRDFKDLGTTYGKWVLLVQAEQRAALHDIIASLLVIVLLMLLVFFLNRMIEHFFARFKLEAKQRATLQAVTRISAQVVAALVILIVIFGPPNQLSTVLGLAGAGLTVVLKDFIVSFLGWFVLMGRHGIRVGDWVEINGVRGEVIEISLLRTVLLETGNWTDAGQLTGRQVAFLNQYAVDGYYFNFSTSGQWLWDELQVFVPAGRDPYPLIAKIRAIVEKETETSTHLADVEWQRLSRRYGVRSFTSQATVHLKPTDSGVVLLVRYITRAEDRAEVRFRLNHEVVKLLHAGAEDMPPGEEPAAHAPVQRAS